MATNRCKSENAKRTSPITAVMHEVLVRQKKISPSAFVFVRRDGKTPVSKWTLDKQQAKRRKKLTSRGMPPFTLSVIALPLAWD